MNNINGYKANSEFHVLYSNIKEHLIELDAFLKHIHEFVSLAENKIGENLEMYSSDFFDYYYAGSYGETFRSSFIVTVSSVVESYIKEYIKIWKENLTDQVTIKNNNAILDYLKEADKKFFCANIDFSKKEVVDLRGLLAIRNALVHSSGNMDDVPKYEPLIKQMVRQYSSIKLSTDGYISTTEQFCIDSLQIISSFFFYLFKLAIRKFPNDSSK